MKLELEVSTEINTIISVDIPIDPRGNAHAQVEDYVEKHQDEIADQAREALFRNMASDWKENLQVYAYEQPE